MSKQSNLRAIRKSYFKFSAVGGWTGYRNHTDLLTVGHFFRLWRLDQILNFLLFLLKLRSNVIWTEMSPSYMSRNQKKFFEWMNEWMNEWKLINRV